jgi:tRNA(fMet)-specific endonuclease VapC
MAARYLLDTNAVSRAADGDYPIIEKRVSGFHPGELYISVITEGEILFGLAKTPEATRKAFLMQAMLRRFSILPWDSETAASYGFIRAEMRRRGRALGPLDMLIAAHAISVDATLVTSDAAFRFVPGLTVEDWARA